MRQPYLSSFEVEGSEFRGLGFRGLGCRGLGFGTIPIVV